ncbi:MAG: formate hydrogenlyase [Azospirillum sp.]|nr:formate hydrogenlyase [Azospirillum sp.]
MPTLSSVLLEILQLILMLVLAPLLVGWVRWLKARLLARRGPPILQPYRDFFRLCGKEVVMAHNASWLYRSAPYLVFVFVWTAAALVPTFTTDLALSPAFDLIAVVGLLGTARFMTALAGMDVGTSFGGIGSSREMLIAALAEPAMLMVIFILGIVVHSTALPDIANAMMSGTLGLRVSFAMALFAILLVAIAENGRIPIDNPATHLELTMVHEAMVLEYSGRHLALIEAAGMLRLTLYIALICSIFVSFGMATPGAGAGAILVGLALVPVKLAVGGAMVAIFETSIAKMRVFRYPEFLAMAFLMGLLGVILLYISRGW